MHRTPLTIGVSTVAAPRFDDDATTALEEALDTLRLLRGGEPHNGADRLTAVATKAATAQGMVPDAVHRGFTWDQIAHCTGLSASSARRLHRRGSPRTHPPVD